MSLHRRRFSFTHGRGRSVRSIMLAIACAALAASPALAVEVASDRFDSDSNLTSFSQTPAPGAFSSPGDGFEEYQRGVSASIPFALLDDSTTFPPETLGMVNSTKLDRWFGVVDTVNGDNPAGNGTVDWEFDVTGFTDLSVSIDFAAMGDFEASNDSFNFTYSFDNILFSPLFTSSVDEDGSLTYTLEAGAPTFQFTLDDPLLMNGTVLDNNFQTLSAAAPGVGNTLYLRFVGGGDGGSEGFAFDNVVINGVPEPSTFVLIGMGSLGLGWAAIRRRRKRS